MRADLDYVHKVENAKAREVMNDQLASKGANRNHLVSTPYLEVEAQRPCCRDNRFIKKNAPICTQLHKTTSKSQTEQIRFRKSAVIASLADGGKMRVNWVAVRDVDQPNNLVRAKHGGSWTAMHAGTLGDSRLPAMLVGLP